MESLLPEYSAFDAVGHMVASGLGIAALPKGAALPLSLIHI